MIVKTKTRDKQQKNNWKKEKKKETVQLKNDGGPGLFPKNKKKEKEKNKRSVTDGTNSKEENFDPSVGTALKAFLSAALCAAMWSNISDCDETYNYWEPSHFLLYGKGFQTWEYSPTYALRSYTYLLLHVVPVLLYAKILQANRMLIFYIVRCMLGLFCTYCETYFYKAVYRKFGKDVAKMVLVFLIFSPGMFISSTAFLPSSFSMYMCLLSTAAWMNKKYELAIFTVALSTFISWPFAALLGVPIALDILLVKRLYKKFILWSIISSVLIMVPLIKMDSDLYGRFVIAPLNIVMYNIFTSHGPNLYGTEPICFYFINGFLNFNLVFISAILAPSFILLRNFVLSMKKGKSFYFSNWEILVPFYIWFIVFTFQPHKEERFLFPVYPMICLCGAIAIDSFQITCSAMFNFKKAHLFKRLNSIACALVIVLGVSRIAALYKGYHAPMDIFMELNKLHAEGRIEPNVPVNVCIGKEWHRFPTSFFLPNNDWNLKFIRSEFRGQLPAEYSPQENATAIVHSHFNDLNTEEPSRYFDINQCHFLIDCDYGKETKLEPNYGKQTKKWTPVATIPFLNSEKSNPFYRAFYVPYLSEGYCSYANYTLFKSTKFKLKELYQ